ncbi:hypothetical protein [Nocardia sp. NPDC059239]|uniref:hypothetical protein n=1 Tax=unclassified Nocardia TaxID=2637762 RepID=UPI0036818D01
MSYTLVAGTLELVAAWLRGEFATSREHLVDVVSAMLLSSTHITTQLPTDRR